MAVFRMLFGVPFRGLLGSTVVEVPVSSTTGPGWPSLSLSLSDLLVPSRYARSTGATVAHPVAHPR